MKPGKVLFLGKLRDIAGCAEAELPQAAVNCPLSALVAFVTEGNDLLLEALLDPSVRVAVNKSMLAHGADPVIAAHDEIAFLPPMSGG